MSVPLVFICTKKGSDASSNFVFSILAIAFFLIGTYLCYHIFFMIPGAYYRISNSLGQLLLFALLVCYSLALIGISLYFVWKAESFSVCSIMSLICLSIVIFLVIMNYPSRSLMWQVFAYPILLLIPRFLFVGKFSAYNAQNVDNTFMTAMMYINGFLAFLGIIFAAFAELNGLPYTDIKTAPWAISLVGTIFNGIAMCVPIGYADYTVPLCLYDAKVRNTWIGLILIPVCLAPFAVPLLMGL